jgi:uncharacterized glyoxalase superfamily protein PhnB
VKVGAVLAGGLEIFLCRDGQGGRDDNDAWMSIWVDDVDGVHERALAAGLEITHPPTDEPWNVREFHVRHPDGHVLRISRSTI